MTKADVEKERPLEKKKQAILEAVRLCIDLRFAAGFTRMSARSVKASQRRINKITSSRRK